MDQDQPVIEVVPRDELPDDEQVQLVVDDEDQPCALRIREDMPIASVAEAINEVASRRVRRSNSRDAEEGAAD